VESSVTGVVYALYGGISDDEETSITPHRDTADRAKDSPGYYARSLLIMQGSE
jgi:hypothetical protein